MTYKKRSFLSSEGKRRIQVYIWERENPIGILQFSHGMKEHALRYDEMARYFNDRGYMVIGNDHLGHGKSILSKKDTGFFGLPDGNAYLVEDLHRTYEIGKEYGELPTFLLGHSMGSFLVREFLLDYPKVDLAGVILMGTTEISNPILKTGKWITKIHRKYFGEDYRSPVIKRLAYDLNRPINRTDTGLDWVSSLDYEVLNFSKDPLTQFDFTANGYYFLLDAMEQMDPLKAQEQMEDRPILILSGQDDPIGQFGRCPRQTYEKYKKSGLRDVKLKLYPGNRHELLHDKDKDLVLKEIYQWMEERKEQWSENI